jgi:hypothetical protein
MRLFLIIGVVALDLDGLNAALFAQGSVRNALRGELVGCYALFAEGGKRVDSSFYHASPLVRLLATANPVFAAHPEFGARRLLLRLDGSGHRLDVLDPSHRLGPGWWADSLSDSIRVSFGDGFSGALLTLAAPPRGSDTLQGRIEEQWDYREPTRQGPAYAVRVPCVK